MTLLDILSESPMDKKSLLKMANTGSRKGSRYIALLIGLGLAQKTEVITLSGLSRITGSGLAITQKGADCLNRYIDLQERNANCTSMSA
jgi:predicted transcriptional regulator